MLFAAIRCNLAWGIIDGVFYLMGCLAEAARKIAIWDAVRKNMDPEGARRALAAALPPAFASALEPAEVEAMQPSAAGTPRGA